MRSRSNSWAGKSLVMVLIVCALVAVTAGTGVGVLMGRRAAGSKTGHGAKESAAKAGTAAGTVFSLGEMVVNLADTDTLRYAKLNVALAIQEKVADEKLKEQAPVLRDVVIDVLTRKRFSDLHRAGGIRNLKLEVRRAAAKRLHEYTIVEVYLDSFAMQ